MSGFGLTGRTVKAIRPMNDEELEAEGWEDGLDGCTVIELDDGTKIYPSRDTEGNGPGCLFGILPDGTPFGVN